MTTTPVAMYVSSSTLDSRSRRPPGSRTTLAALGVTHAYCSPYLQAAAGSTHGYDVWIIAW